MKSEDIAKLEELKNALAEVDNPQTACLTSMSSLPREEQKKRLGATPPKDVTSLEEVDRAWKYKERVIKGSVAKNPKKYVNL